MGFSSVFPITSSSYPYKVFHRSYRLFLCPDLPGVIFPPVICVWHIPISFSFLFFSFFTLDTTAPAALYTTVSFFCHHFHLHQLFFICPYTFHRSLSCTLPRHPPLSLFTYLIFVVHLRLAFGLLVALFASSSSSLSRLVLFISYTTPQEGLAGFSPFYYFLL